MNLARLRAVWLASGAFGGEFVLLVSMPLIGQRYGSAAVALLGVAIVAANCGKLLGCLKMDAAITNVPDDEVGTVHAAALACALATGAAALVLQAAMQRSGLLPPLAREAGPAVVVAFACGALQQAATMRLLRDDRLATFAAMKALPSVALVALLALMAPARLLDGYIEAWSVTALVAAALHLRMPRAGIARLRGAVQRTLVASRTYLLHGAPGAALDAGNLFLLSLVTIGVAGAQAAGEAQQVQRLALAPSLAASLLLGQQVWRHRFDGRDVTAAWRADWSRTARWSLAAAVASAVVIAVLLVVRGPVDPAPRSPLVPGFAIVACLAPLLAQYATSPLTIYFFKRRRLGAYGRLQVGILAALGAAAALGPLAHPGSPARDATLLLLAAFTSGVTAATSRRALSHPDPRTS